MIKNYLRIAFRNLAKHKTFSLINIGGLALSLASCLFILYFIYDEVTYDQHNQNVDRIFRITQTFITPENTQNIRWTHQKVGPYLVRNYPQVEQFVRFEGERTKLGKNKTKEPGVVKADASVFEIFTFNFIAGNASSALEKPNSIVLTQSLARKYFRGDALGQMIDVDGVAHQVTAIIQDLPANTDKLITAIAHGGFQGEEIPQLHFVYDTYVLLRSADDATFITTKLDEAANELHASMSGPGMKMGFDLQPLKGLHFNHATEMDHPKGNKSQVYILGGVALTLLVIVIINFINLSTVRSLERAKEVGIRKVVGAKKDQLVRQFLGESFVSVILASIGALLVIEVLRKIFHTISGKTISFSNEHDLTIIAVTLILLIAIAIAASLYPAWVLSSHVPAKVLKGQVRSGSNAGTVRKIFTVAQFAMSTGLLLFLITTLFQMSFMKNADLGFSKDEILVIQTPEEDTLVRTNLAYYVNELKKCKAVEEVSVGGFASNLGTTETFASPVWIHNPEGKRQVIAPNIVVDKNYPSMLKLKVKQGQNFSNVQGSVSGKALVNEAFVKMAGWKNPIGETISTYGGEAKVVGVVNDFHFQSLHNTIEPMALMGMNQNQPDARHFFIKTSAKGLDEVRVAWKRLLPNYEMEYFFLNDFFNAQYRAEENMQIIFLCFTVLAIVISASGLFGLTIYHVELKTREIGIRKVFGADVGSLIKLLSADFIKLVAIGSAIGLAAGYFFTQQWLQTFAYRVDITIIKLLIPAITVVILSTLIIVSKTYRGAMANPIEVIRHE